MGLINKLKKIYFDYKQLIIRLENIQETLGRIESRQLKSAGTSMQDSEFRVFSQWGEDGIIQYLINKIHIKNKIFIEFGVENYFQSNTRFLLKNNNWSGLVIDASSDNIQQIKKDDIYWQYNLKVERSFITTENINNLFINNGIEGEIGLLSIDIDGNDYWVWHAIEVVTPAIVICEYNSRFGPREKVTVPYDPQFQRSVAHYSNLYYGASISALEALGRLKGYALIGSNTAGNNAFFVRGDLLGELVPVSPQAAFRQAQFRESRGKDGVTTGQGWETGFGEASDLPVYEVDSQRVVPIRALNLASK